ncbi:MAG: hypothetical protein A3J24_11750 [Deltaproteobacteria bacterium RIFCSPLOWO2_02_FULL_53_8]|nr:MAG: hypothetical protein A3J24_11750 [Deltaproteobacteria bacterium RIFCSPLOWO2_02_FULL_53_8]
MQTDPSVEDESPAAMPYIGCAGWNVPNAVAACFPAQGSHLERYASVLSAVEINTSFYRPHRSETYVRWRDSVPESFRFAVKMPRTITHHLRLKNVDDALQRFLAEAGNLQEKLGCLLVQLPPSLHYDAATAERFFDVLRAGTTAPVACEPRHVTWFGAEASALLARWQIARVIADPSIVENAQPATYEKIVYVRLHGSPVIYRSAYSGDYLDALAGSLAVHMRLGRTVWCIFDNTAEGAAVPNALSLAARFNA